MHASRSPHKSTMTNYKATQQIKKLYANSDARKLDHFDKMQRIDDALRIYQQIGETKNHFVIHTLLRLGLHFHGSDAILPVIWNDIKSLKHELSIPLLMRCCVETSSFPISRSIKVLKWAKQRGIKLSDLDSNEMKMLTLSISKLLNSPQCDNVKYVMRVHSVVDESDIFIQNLLIRGYGHFGKIKNAEKVFESISETERDSVTLNTMLTAYSNAGKHRDVLAMYHIYDRLQDDISHLLAIKSYTVCGDQVGGQNIIDSKLKSFDAHHHLAESHSVGLHGTLIMFYGRFGQMDRAKEIFEDLPLSKRTPIAIGSMMKALTHNDCNAEALELYESLFYGDDHILNDVLHILGMQCVLNLDEKDRFNAIKDRLHWTLHRDLNRHSIELRNSLLRCHAHFGDIGAAQKVFDGIKRTDRTVVTIGTMMNALCDAQREEECIAMFQSIRNKYEFEPDAVCYSIAIRACTQSTAIHFGKSLFEEMKEREDGMIREEAIVVALIGMFGKFGMMTLCEDIFRGMLTMQKEQNDDDGEREMVDITVWNALVNAYGVNGDLESVQRIVLEMENAGMSPDEKTFIALIQCCSHCGAVEIAQRIWNEIESEEMKYNHFVVTALIDAYSKKGQLQEGYDLLSQIDERCGTDEVMWISLLNGCSKHKERQLAQTVYDAMTVRFDSSSLKMTSAAVLLSNLFAS